MPSKLLTVSQAAQVKGVSRTAVYAAIERGRLSHQVILGHIGLRESDVMAWEPLGIKTGRPKGIPMSEAAKVRLSESQKRRWQRRKQSKS